MALLLVRTDTTQVSDGDRLQIRMKPFWGESAHVIGGTPEGYLHTVFLVKPDGKRLSLNMYFEIKPSESAGAMKFATQVASMLRLPNVGYVDEKSVNRKAAGS